MSIETAVMYFFASFSLIMLGLAIVMAVVCTAAQRSTPGRGFGEQLFRWTAMLPVGVVGLFAFYMHVFDPERASAGIGWEPSPFEYEVGMVNLVLGVLGILAVWGSRGFRLATTIAVVIMLWGCAIGHVKQMIVAHNFAPGNAGPWFWTDVATPCVMILAFWLSGRAARQALSRNQASLAA